MKKIFTFLFFAGLMTTAMAQNSRNAQHRDQSKGNNSTVYSNNQGYGQPNAGYGQSSQGNNGYGQNNSSYQKDQGYNQHPENEYGNGGRNEDKRFDDRQADHRYHNNDHFDQRVYGYEKRREYENNNRGRFNAGVSIRFGQPGCF